MLGWNPIVGYFVKNLHLQVLQVIAHPPSAGVCRSSALNLDTFSPYHSGCHAWTPPRENDVAENDAKTSRRENVRCLVAVNHVF